MLETLGSDKMAIYKLQTYAIYWIQNQCHIFILNPQTTHSQRSPQPHSQPSTWSCSGTAWASAPSSPSASSWSAQSQKGPALWPVTDNQTSASEWINKVAHLVLIVLDELEQPDVGASPTHPCTAVDQHGARAVQKNLLSRFKQIKQRFGNFWGFHVRPACAVQLLNCALLSWQSTDCYGISFKIK